MSKESRQIFEVVDDEFRKHPDWDVVIPSRATPGSAGYDFMIPTTIKADDLVKAHNGEIIIYTDIKANLKEGEVLKLYIRSSIGIKREWSLKNAVGIIDSDYYNNPETGGNIIFALKSLSKYRNYLEPGEYVMQGVIENYIIDDTPARNEERLGGVGSSGK